MEREYDGVCFDLFGTLTDGKGRPLPGAIAILGSVIGARWAIVTSCPRGYARTLIECAGFPRPPVTVTADDVKRSKPAPECYLLAASRLSIEPSRTLAIEDSSSGLAAARAAGMDAIDTPVAELQLEVRRDGVILRRR